jgi:hypothetical protein
MIKFFKAISAFISGLFGGPQDAPSVASIVAGVSTSLATTPADWTHFAVKNTLLEKIACVENAKLGVWITEVEAPLSRVLIVNGVLIRSKANKTALEAAFMGWFDHLQTQALQAVVVKATTVPPGAIVGKLSHLPA